MVRKSKLLTTGPSKLSQLLVQLNAPPKLTLNPLKSLRLSYAFRNDHFGARHFVREQLPKIRYANPALDIQVERVRKSPQEAWRPEITVEFENGIVQTIDMHEKLSTTILKELMDLAGGDSWRLWKSQARAAGQPIIPGEESEAHLKKNPSNASGALPSLAVFRESQQQSINTLTPGAPTPDALKQVETA